MKIRISTVGILALSSIISSVAFAQSQPVGGRSFTIGNYRFHARTQQSNGLMRGVTIDQVSGASKTPSKVSAQFARQDPTNSNRFILGGVVVRRYNRNGTLISESTATRLHINAGRQP